MKYAENSDNDEELEKEIERRLKRMEYRYEHREELNAKMRAYFKTPKGKEVIKKVMNRRHRNLGFEPLNKPFEGAEAHHIDNNQVLYIPKSLHRSIKHCLENGKNMQEINTLAVQWWIKDLIIKSNFWYAF
jgi:hypothetical protein